MKICVAQTRPIKGDIQSNIDHHKRLIDLAVSNGADTVIFPELSLTGYEPESVYTGDRHVIFDHFLQKPLDVAHLETLLLPKTSPT